MSARAMEGKSGRVRDQLTRAVPGNQISLLIGSTETSPSLPASPSPGHTLGWSHPRFQTFGAGGLDVRGSRGLLFRGRFKRVSWRDSSV
eukprot:2023483-Rhodomonas_salina.1